MLAADYLVEIVTIEIRLDSVELAMQLVAPVILCGGSGTRLWPVSRDSYPKQFVPLFGGLSTFQSTLRRVSDRSIFSKPLIVTNEQFRFIVDEQSKALGIETDILLEPLARDSAPAIAAASFYLTTLRKDEIGLVLAADHIVSAIPEFNQCTQIGLPAAAAGKIMTFGVTPSHASTAYGYIKPGKALLEGCSVIDTFIEKPDSPTAGGLIADGCLWNSGNFMFRPDVMLSELERYAPEILDASKRAFDQRTIDLGAARLDEQAFAEAPKISIDYAVMQRTSLAGVIKATFDWSDIGTWGSLWEASPHDEAGNRISGRVELAETQNSVVHSDDVLTVVIGLKDVVVVTTRDAVLVTSRDESAKVKTIVEAMKARSIREASEHLKMYRPWGSYQRIDLGNRFQVKRITVNPGGRLSLQKHFHRSEHWVVVSGTAEVTIGDKQILLHENESTYIQVGEIHRLANPGKVPLELIEVQVGSYTGEDDIVRIEDVYGRG